MYRAILPSPIVGVGAVKFDLMCARVIDNKRRIVDECDLLINHICALIDYVCAIHGMAPTRVTSPTLLTIGGKTQCSERLELVES